MCLPLVTKLSLLLRHESRNALRQCQRCFRPLPLRNALHQPQLVDLSTRGQYRMPLSRKQAKFMPFFKSLLFIFINWKWPSRKASQCRFLEVLPLADPGDNHHTWCPGPDLKRRSRNGRGIFSGCRPTLVTFQCFWLQQKHQ